MGIYISVGWYLHYLPHPRNHISAVKAHAAYIYVRVATYRLPQILWNNKLLASHATYPQDQSEQHPYSCSFYNSQSRLKVKGISVLVLHIPKKSESTPARVYVR